MSSGLFYLNETDFTVKETQKGKTLSVGIEGYSLVLFYSTKCQHCQTLIPVFKKLPNTVGGCTFAMVNISQNKGIVTKSSTTKSPIKYVPLMILMIKEVAADVVTCWVQPVSCGCHAVHSFDHTSKLLLPCGSRV